MRSGNGSELCLCGYSKAVMHHAMLRCSVHPMMAYHLRRCLVGGGPLVLPFCAARAARCVRKW